MKYIKWDSLYFIYEAVVLEKIAVERASEDSSDLVKRPERPDCMRVEHDGRFLKTHYLSSGRGQLEEANEDEAKPNQHLSTKQQVIEDPLPYTTTKFSKH